MAEVQKIETQHRKLVSGSTIINHRIRVEMKLTLEEYVLMDFVYQHNEKKEDPITFRDYYRETGFMPEDVNDFMFRMKVNKLLVWDAKKKRVDVNETWKVHFSTNGEFDKFWKVLTKGNKTEAKSRFQKVRKKISSEELMEKLLAYVKHCDANNTFKKGLDVWLNPSKEHWNDPLVGNPVKTGPTKPVNRTQINFKS